MLNSHGGLKARIESMTTLQWGLISTAATALFTLNTIISWMCLVRISGSWGGVWEAAFAAGVLIFPLAATFFFLAALVLLVTAFVLFCAR